MSEENDPIPRTGGRPDGRRDGPPWVAMAIVAAAGLAVRAVLLALSGEPQLQSDEANYVYLALGVLRFDIVFDQYRYVWPPAYAWIMARGFEWFGHDGLTAVKALQVAVSGVIGWTTMLFAWRLVSRRAAVVTGALWAAYLPLAAFTHLLWNEPLFLALFVPALYQVLRGLEEGRREDGRPDRHLVAAGLLLGGALYFKEMPLYLAPALGALVLVVTWRARGAGAAVRRGVLVPLACAVVVLPWTLRNYEIYGRLAVAGATLGENAYVGLNTRYVNFDYVPVEIERRGDEDLEPLATLERTWFTAPPEPEMEPWPRAVEVTNAIDRQREQVRRGLAFAREHPGWFVRTRVKKVADLVAPMSFFVRHAALRNYGDAPLGDAALRRPLVAWTILSTVAVIVLAALGAWCAVGSGLALGVLGLTGAYVLATSMVVSMSRFRAPLEPFLLVLAGAVIAHGLPLRSRGRLAGAAATLLVLAGLWWIDLPEYRAVFAMALGADS